MTDQHTPLTVQQLDAYETAARNAARIGSGIDPAAVLELATEARRLRAELERRTEDLAFLERNTLPEARRDIQHHQAGKQRWRERAERAEARVAKTLSTEADEIVAHCPDHGPAEQPTVWMDCHCPVADDMRRRAAASAVSGAADSRPA